MAQQLEPVQLEVMRITKLQSASSTSSSGNEQSFSQQTTLSQKHITGLLQQEQIQYVKGYLSSASSHGVDMLGILPRLCSLR